MTEYDIPENKPVTFRLTDAEHIRFWKLMAIANSRKFRNKSDLMRELLGVSEVNVLTPEEINYFQTGDKAATGNAKGVSSTKIKVTKNKGKKDEAA